MLEVWMKDHEVLVRDPETGLTRVLVNVQSVTFLDGTRFPAEEDKPSMSLAKTVQTLGGPVEVRN
jgi:hypothetical protein